MDPEDADMCVKIAHVLKKRPEMLDFFLELIDRVEEAEDPDYVPMAAKEDEDEDEEVKIQNEPKYKVHIDSKGFHSLKFKK
jgi:hypothetical protein